MMEITKGIPIPDIDKGQGKRLYPFRDMEIGDSFQVPADKKMQVVPAAFNYGKRNGKRFSVRTTPAETRCWRVA